MKIKHRITQTIASAWSEQRSPRNLLALSALLALLGLVFIVYKLTLSWAAPELSRAEIRIETQKAELQSLTSRLEFVKKQQKVTDQEIRVLRQANQLLRAEESNRQSELNTLKGELDFYQRLAGTSGSQSGLAVYHLELNPTGSMRVFRFVLTLTQNLRRSAITSGKVRIDLEGTLEDRPLSLPWSQISDGLKPEPEFRFKYFQQLDGYLALPEQFQPSRLLISLEVKGQKKPVSRNFDWDELTDRREGAVEAPDSVPETELEQELSDSVPE